jgi:hypothetical protein
MGFGLIFWILMLLWLLFGVWGVYTPTAFGGRVWYGHGLFLFILFLLIGWRVFGAPVHP